MANRSFWRVGHWPTLLSAFLYFDVSFMIWVLLGALGNYVAAQFQLSPAEKGLMTAVPLLGGSLLRLVLGYLTDTIGPKRTGLLGMAVTAVPLCLGWLWADSMPKLYLVGLLLGVAGASFAAALPLAGRWYPPQYQGLAMGIAGAGNSGTLFATLFAPRLAELYGWRAVFALALIPLILVAVVFVCCAREAPGSRPGGACRESFLSVLRERDTGIFCFFYAITFGGFVGLASFLSVYLHDRYGVSRVAAGDLTSLTVLAGSLLRPVGGALADRFGGLRMLRLLYGSVGLLLVLVTRADTAGVATALLVGIMACLGMGNGAVFQLVPHRYSANLGAATGILGAAGGCGGFVVPNLLGSSRQWFDSYEPGYFGLAMMAALALVVLLRVEVRWVGRWIAEHGRALPRAEEVWLRPGRETEVAVSPK
ncbi:MAG: NarK/NasA family nitrate transporter [Limisphaera sp.]|nr:NarK/NasA family nitrate transporter [Limisphaera sp.]